MIHIKHQLLCYRISKIQRVGDDDNPADNVQNYQTQTLGTVHWMAPEFLREKKFDWRSDVYSFGITLWELISEKQPHDHLMPVQVLFQVVNNGLRPEKPEILGQVGEAGLNLGELINNCMQEDPILRPSFLEITSELKYLTIFHDEYSHGNVNNDNLRCFLRQFDCYAAISEESSSEVWGTTQQQLCDDLSRLVRRYDKDVNGSWSFREFLSFAAPLSQYSLKAKDLQTGIALNAGATPQKDKQLLAETSSTASLGECHAQEELLIDLLKGGRESRTTKTIDRNTGPGFSRASKSTAAQSVMGGAESFTKGQNNYSQIGGGQHFNQQSSIGPNYSQYGVDHDENVNMRNFDSSIGGNNTGVLNYPYMCDQQPGNLAEQELQFADKIKLMNSQKTKAAPGKSGLAMISSASGDALSTILIQTFVDMMQVEGDLEKRKRELAMRQDFNLTDAYKLFNSVKQGKRGFDVDDLYYVLREYLVLGQLTKDEVFILFYKLDRDGDGFVTYADIGRAFVPRSQHEYAVLLESRGPYHGDHTQPREFFSPETRDLLRRTVRGIIDCEVSIELIKQRLLNHNKAFPSGSGVSQSEMAFKAIEGYSMARKKMVSSKRPIGLTADDIRDFLKQASGGNVYPVEKELQLLFDRLDRDQDGLVSLPDFAAGISPFMAGSHQPEGHASAAGGGSM